MKAGFSLLKARLALMLSAALVIAAAVPLLYLGTLVGWQIAMRYQAGQWLPLSASGLFPLALHPSVPWVMGVVGLAVGALGVLGVFRQHELIRAHRQEREDRLRRVEEYRRDERLTDGIDGRREPYISDRRAA